ncbi:hypothetical protein DL769_004431 [Monosporascus sp. CRB-8-3]|nr:hypothetical protein DL769_004431 [Monosporascus sp. CRB-8-3]
MTQFITVEEHFLSDHLPDDEHNIAKPPAISAAAKEKLREIGKVRLQSMDENNIKFGVISHLVAAADPSVCRSINDDMHARVSEHPNRFAAFGILSMYDPASAAVELERCVRDLGFVGALIPTHLPDGTFYDTPKFYPVFEAAQKLDVPIYLHPTYSSPAVKKLLYDGPYPDDVALALSGWCGGFYYENGLHILRLFASGLFDRYPRLKIMIGHTGEMLPYMLERNLEYTAWWSNASSRKRDLREVWDNNIWMSTSGSYHLSPMACLLRVTKPQRVLYAVDYPMGSNEQGKKFLEDLRKSGLVSEEDWECIAWKNARDLLRLNV